MSDLRILFASASDGGYRAQLADTKGRRIGVEVPFTPFLTEDDNEDLRWYLEDYMELPDGGAVVRAERIEREIERWGRRLYETFFSIPDHRMSRQGSDSSRTQAPCPALPAGVRFRVRPFFSQGAHMNAPKNDLGPERPVQPRSAAFLDDLEAEIWPTVRPCETGRRLTRREEEEILGIGPDGV